MFISERFRKNMMKAIKKIFFVLFKKRGLKNFLLSFNNQSLKILDVGCGNNSASRIKKHLSKCYYVGVDIENYNCSKENEKYIDKLILSNPGSFDKAIKKIDFEFDLIISSHNLEHCLKREKVLKAIADKLKNGGKLYLSFPSEKSISFPMRSGTLNYFRDPTHRDSPPIFKDVIRLLEDKNINIKYACPSYKPFLGFLIGILLEPVSIITGKVFSFTWALYGFEAIIHGEKNEQPN